MGRKSRKRIKKRRYLLPKPAGPGEKGGYGGGFWNNQSFGTDGPITCELCGTEHPEDKLTSYTISSFLGLQVVEECCGRVLDIVYRESGADFAERFLEEFAENSTNPRFYTLTCVLRRVLSKAEECLAKKLTEVQSLNEQIKQFP